jgi:glycosyltransferase involved in cell wall biosynthesis
MDERRRRVAVTLEQCWHRVPGGTAVATLEQVTALAERDDVEIIGVSARHGHAAAEPFRPSVPVRSLPLPRPALYESWHRLRRPGVEVATGPVDVIHATAVAIPPRTAPLVVTIHDLAFLADRSQATAHGNRFFRRGTDLARRHADLVLCPSQATVDECLAAGFDADRLRLIPWGVHSRPASESDIQRARAHYRLTKPYVLFNGTIEPRKNLGALMTAFAGLDGHDVDLVLVGPEGWNEDLGALTAPLGDRVKALGFLPRADLDALLAGAAVFCYPSLREGFGLPVLEAMAQGTAVVTSSGTATEEVAGDAALLVDPLDPSTITDALDWLLSDPDTVEELGRRGRRRAAEFTWRRTADLTAAAYAEVAP